METMNAGLIEFNQPTDPYLIDETGSFNGYHVKKVMLKEETAALTKEKFSGAELVHDTSDILEDESIHLVIVSAPDEADMSLVGKALQAGKQVRIL